MLWVPAAPCGDSTVLQSMPEIQNPKHNNQKELPSRQQGEVQRHLLGKAGIVAARKSSPGIAFKRPREAGPLNPSLVSSRSNRTRENGVHDLGNSEIKLLLDVAGAIAHLHAEERVLQEHPAKDSPGFGEGLRDVVWVKRPGRRFGSNHCLEVDG